MEKLFCCFINSSCFSSFPSLLNVNSSLFGVFDRGPLIVFAWPPFKLLGVPLASAWFPLPWVSFFYALVVRCCRLSFLPLFHAFEGHVYSLFMLFRSFCLVAFSSFRFLLFPSFTCFQPLLGSRGSCCQAAAKTFGCYRTILLCSHGFPCSCLPCCCFQGLFLASFRVLSCYLLCFLISCLTLFHLPATYNILFIQRHLFLLHAGNLCNISFLSASQKASWD